MDSLGEDKKEVERRYIKTILIALAKELHSKKYPEEYLNQKTKIAKIICILASKLDLPITISWYRHGQYPFIQDLNIDLYNMLLDIYKNLDRNINELNQSMKSVYKNILDTFKVINPTEIMKKNFYIFLEQYYNNPDFNKNKYIGLYRRYFQLGNFLNNEFEPNLKIFLKGFEKADYTKYITEEYDSTEEEPLFKKYTSQTNQLRIFFNNFLYELSNPRYNFPEEIKEDVYDSFNTFEKVCLKIDLIFSKANYDQKIISEYELIDRTIIFFWETITSFISIKDNKGPRTKDLIEYYTNKYDKHIKLLPQKLIELDKKIANSGLRLDKHEFNAIKSNDERIKELVHEFALRA